ncbi:2946_t:CDS:10 [Paraglomus brasilianum]|uniref:2946_t:CDS:1 n=1 Tax=Paraglomus brasilianum TaxID=144538 RepID=A0A9N9BXF1_9GLOM|nr:2946_t:CDS:10 [Paraglomus brasilianum]
MSQPIESTVLDDRTVPHEEVEYPNEIITATKNIETNGHFKEAMPLTEHALSLLASTESQNFLHDQTIHSTPDFDSDSDSSLGSLETLSSSGLESLAAETFETVKLSPKVSTPTNNTIVRQHRRGKRVRDDKSYSDNRRASTRASRVNALESNSKRRSKRIRTGRRKLAQANAGPKQALTLAEKKLCDSCHAIHLDVIQVYDLSLCSYCRGVFYDNIGVRRSRCAGQSRFDQFKRVKVLCRDNKWYPGVVMEYKQERFKVHFDGWDEIYDEWIPTNSRRMRDVTLEEFLGRQQSSDDVPARKVAEINSGSDVEIDLTADLQLTPTTPTAEVQSTGTDDQTSQLRRGKRARGDKSYSNNQRSGTRANSLASTSKRLSKRIRTGRPKLEYSAQVNAIPEQALTSAEKKLCDSCHAIHLDVIQVYDLSLCSYCRGVFYDNIGIRRSRCAGQSRFDQFKRVKVLCRDNKWYPGVVMEYKQERFRVRFDGWDESYDEWIPTNSRRMQDVTLEELLGLQQSSDDVPARKAVETETESDVEIDLTADLQLTPTTPTAEAQSTGSDDQTSLPAPLTPSSTDDGFDWRELYLRRSPRKRGHKNKAPFRYDEDSFTNQAELKARFRPGAKVEARDKWREWHFGRVIQAKGYRVLIHYDDLPSVYDEWIDMNSERLKGGYEPGEGPDDDEGDRKKNIGKAKAIQEEDWEYVKNGIKYSNGRTKCVCYAHNFPDFHDHPRCSFAVQTVIGDQAPQITSKGDLVSTFEKDMIDETYSTAHLDLLNSTKPLVGDTGYMYLKAWRSRRICGFCNDDDNNHLGGFIGPYPFISCAATRHGERKKIFWSHYACAKYSPEVFQSKDNVWYNVTTAWRRGRGMKCSKCKERGATIGCFEPKCTRSFHLPCTDKPLEHFEMGVIFYCPTHEAFYDKREEYNELFRCDVCAQEMDTDKWWTCKPCSTRFFNSFDLCPKCYTGQFPEHEHAKESFEEISLQKIKDERITRQAKIAVANQKARATGIRKRPKQFPQKKERIHCSYCWSEESSRWRKGYEGVLMCEDCFEVALVNNSASDSHLGAEYVTSFEDYIHAPYLTRTSVAASKFDNSISQARYLDNYEPLENQLFSLPFDSSYFDIPGRAPRWATHSGTDYHGTWLPQTVRRALQRYTRKNDRILSNFLGRGTDAIECFLLSRRCIGIDINPAAVALSQRNCSFAIHPGKGITAEHRPIIVQSDSRELRGSLFEDESFDHVLSHPPYKNCVEYSTHIDGDLSRYANSKDFNLEMQKVVDESWRLLKPGRRTTLGIGDNREQCFYIPVSFQLIREYINRGFLLEELVVKRQRYCSAFGLGTYLCTQYDFLMFTHEFVATLKKVDRESNDRMLLNPTSMGYPRVLGLVNFSRIVREIPSLPIARKSVVMGTTWTFKPTANHDFVLLCTSRMVERFGRDSANWEEIKIEFNNIEQPTDDNGQPSFVQEIVPMIIEDENIPEYERARLKRIRENQKKLLSLGLISDLSEESDDLSHVEKLLSLEALPPPTPIALIVIPHIPNSVLINHDIKDYRIATMHLARESYEKLPPSGFLIIGTQDVRTRDNKLWPLGLLVLEDVKAAVGEDKMPLKELVITVPEGYAKDRRKITSYEEYAEEKCVLDEENINELPIVHACYLVFMKLR